MSKPKIETIELTPDDVKVALSENKPFIIRGNSRQESVGFLLVHGFTGSPWEMRDIGQHLAKDNSRVLGIRLPGHGTSAEDLAEKTYEEWLESVMAGYQILAKDCDQVIGVGLSTGSLLLLAASRDIHFKGLILLSPYLKLRQILAPLAFLFRHFIKYNLRPADLDVSPYYYRERPLASVHQIYRLIRRVKKSLRSIKIPILVASAAGDITVDSRSAIKLYNNLGCERKEYYRFGKEVPHVLTTADNPRQDEILQISSNFAATLSPN